MGQYPNFKKKMMKCFMGFAIKRRLIVMQAGQMARAFAAQEEPGRDYYDVLGIDETATEQEVKDAYRKKAKMYHPDINAMGERHEPNADKFREVAEAYAVLSCRDSRLSYNRIRSSKIGKKVAERRETKEEISLDPRMKEHQINRMKGQAEDRGSFAQHRMEDQRKQREKYNVNSHGFYQGGIPRPDHFFRGKGGIADTFHSPESHNMININNEAMSQVTEFEAQQFRHYQSVEADLEQVPNPWRPLDVDPTMRKARENSRFGFYFVLMILLFGVGNPILLYQRIERWLRFKFCAYETKNVNSVIIRELKDD